MASKNRFSMVGDSILISKDGWKSLAEVTYRDDYYDEIQSVTWSLNNGYVYNSKLGYLHRYIAGKWYGEQVLGDMTKNDFVIDHMDNNSFNCRIDNLSFLSLTKIKPRALQSINRQKK